MDLVYVVWSLFLALLALNFLDYVTTFIALRYCKWMGPVWGAKPLWKNTRPGQWCVRHKLCKPPKWGKVRWYDHEINPVARGLCKRLGLHGLTVLKVIPLAFMALSLSALTILGYPFYWPSIVTFCLICDVYIHVVLHNFKIVRQIEKIYRRWVRRHREKETFEDPLLPI